MKNLWFSDSEVFAHDTLWVFKNEATGEVRAFWNDPNGVAQFISEVNPNLCGYNFRDYDSHILKATLLGWTPEDIKVVNDTIIENDDRSMVWALFQGSPWIDLPTIIDLFHDIVPRKSLKEIEANLGMDVEESTVPFDINRPLTEDERKEVLRYCVHDVTATEALYNERLGYVQAKIDLCKLQGIDPLPMLKHTNARIVSEVLGAVKLIEIPEEQYEIPANIDQTAIPVEVLEYVSKINTDTMWSDDKLDFMFHGCPTTFAMGGIHAAVPAYVETSRDERVILLQDIGSFYPSIILNNGYMSRAVKDDSLFKKFYDLRMEAKAKGDKAMADAAKLVLNTTYGTFKDQYNKLFDPMQGTRVCLSGQLYILDLIEQMFRKTITLQLIQLNTDGWLISCDRGELDTINNVVAEWCKRTNFTVDTTEVQKIVQANVNNYVMFGTDGKVKVKGGVVARQAGGDFKSNSLTIVDLAVTNWLLGQVPIADTVNACTDVTRFQIVAKAGRTFQKVMYGDVEVQRCNRVYATTDKSKPGIVKVKITDGEITGRSKIPMTPDHCIIDNRNEEKDSGNLLTQLDRQWYIDLATKKAKEFLIRSKKEKDEMAETTEPHNEAQDTPAPTKRTRKAAEAAPEAVVTPTFKEKLLALQTAMAGAATGVKFDKVVKNIGYEYADTQQYKKWLGALCTDLRLLYKIDFYGEWLGVVSPDAKTPSYGVTASGTVTISDVDSDEYETYSISGSAVNVQGGYCNGAAQTNAIRNFILNNWNLDNRGREGDDQAFNGESNEKKPATFVNAAEKSQIRGDLIAAEQKDSYAPDIFAAALYEKIQEARVFKPDFATKILREHYNEDGTPKLREDGRSTMLKKDAVMGMTRSEEIIAAGSQND